MSSDSPHRPLETTAVLVWAVTPELIDALRLAKKHLNNARAVNPDDVSLHEAYAMITGLLAESMRVDG